MKKRSKRYRASQEAAGEKRRLEINEAVEVLKKFPGAKFDESVELSFKLGIDARKSDQAVRGSFTLPNGIGKERRVIVFAEGDKAQAARDAGAYEVGSADLAKKIQESVK